MKRPFGRRITLTMCYSLLTSTEMILSTPQGEYFLAWFGNSMPGLFGTKWFWSRSSGTCHGACVGISMVGHLARKFGTGRVQAPARWYIFTTCRWWVSNVVFYFQSRSLGSDPNWLTHMFQMGWVQPPTIQLHFTYSKHVWYIYLRLVGFYSECML